MISNDKMKAIAALDLSAIKAKLMHRESGEGWSAEQASAVETEYRRFLGLMMLYPQEQIAPLVDVDTFWHYHILDTAKYAADCEQAFGYFLHHYPYLGMGDADDAAQRQASAARMHALYEQTFGASYLQAAASLQQAAFCAAANDAAFCAAGARPAFCAAAVKSAFCAAPTGAAFCAATAKSAFCAASAKSAFCAAPAVGAAFCAAANQAAFCAATAKSAFCAATAKTAFCAATGASRAAESPQQALVGT